MATAPKPRANLQPENVDDADHGQGRDAGAAERDDDGIGDELSEQEMEALSNMRTGERDAQGQEEPEPAADDDGGEDDPGSDADDADGVGDDAAAAAAADRDQGARDDRGQQDDKSKQRPKTINYGRHQRELAKRETRLKELEGLLDGERQQRTRLDERTKMLLEAINARPKADDQAAAQQQDDADPEPDKGDDPIGWSEWKIRKLEGVVTRLDSAQQQQQQRTQAETEEQREVDEYTTELRAAARADETVGAAFIHLRESRYAELGAIYAGIDVNDPEQCATLSPQEQAALSRQIQAAFASEQRMVYQAAKRGNRKVGQSILALARARGFNPAAARQQEQQQQDGGDHGARERLPARREAPARRQQEGAPQRERQRSVSEEIDNIREAAGASRSLSDAGGSPAGTVDNARLAEMDDDEFLQFLESVPKNKLDRIMGK